MQIQQYYHTAKINICHKINLDLFYFRVCTP